MSAVIAFFFETKVGRSLGLAILLALAIGITWWRVDARAFARGQADIQAKWDAAVSTARQRATDSTAADAHAASGIAATARTASANATAAVDKTVAQTKEVIRYVYRDPPAGAPVRPGSCVYPLDQRVQDRIQLGLDQAASAAR